MKKQKRTERLMTTKKKSMWHELKHNYFFYLLAIPGIIALIMFSYMPMAGIYMAFTKYTYQGGIFGSTFVGLQNFKFFFANLHNAIRATRNTIVINFGSMLLGTFLNVATAVMLAEITREKFRKSIQTMILFPYFLSWIVIGAISNTLLDNNAGLLNQLIQMLGGEPVMWNMKPWYWWPIIIIATVWHGFGYGSIVYYATITGFDPCLYEAAEMDGASRFKRITSITLPMLKPTIAILFLLDAGSILKGSLDQIMGMTQLNPMLFETTDTITTFVYRTATQNGQFGFGSAISLYQSVFGFIFVLAANLIAKKINPDYALF